MNTHAFNRALPTCITHETFNGHSVAFRKDTGFCNLHELCGAYGRNPSVFLGQKTTQDYISSLRWVLRQRCIQAGNDCAEITVTELCDNIIWAHPDLAQVCARWLSPACGALVSQVLSRIQCDGANRPMGIAERRVIEQRLKLRSAELRAELEALREQLDALKTSAELDGFLPVPEWLREHDVKLDHSALTKLCLRLNALARRGYIHTGAKTIPTGGRDRVKRVATFAPSDIREIYLDIEREKEAA